MSAGGSHPVNLTVRPLRDGSPAWSPGGDRIAIVSRRDGNAEICILDVTFSYLTRITFSSNRDFNSEIYIMNAEAPPYDVDVGGRVLV